MRKEEKDVFQREMDRTKKTCARLAQRLQYISTIPVKRYNQRLQKYNPIITNFQMNVAQEAWQGFV